MGYPDGSSLRSRTLFFPRQWNLHPKQLREGVARVVVLGPHMHTIKCACHTCNNARNLPRRLVTKLINVSPGIVRAWAAMLATMGLNKDHNEGESEGHNEGHNLSKTCSLYSKQSTCVQISSGMEKGRTI